MRKKIISGIIGIVTLVPVAALAQTTDAMSQLLALQQQVAQLLAQLQALQGGGGGGGTVSSSQIACPSPVLVRNLGYGDTGPDVAGLQAFLIAAGYLAPGNVTGFFGPLTQTAVQQFQSSQGVVTGGSPDTTGYGVVGPRTRQAIIQVCSTGSVIPPPPTPMTVPVSINQFIATPSTVTPGQASTLLWTVQGAASCILTQQVPGGPIVTLSASLSASGSIVVNPAATSIYSIICTAVGQGVGASQSVIVTVGGSTPTASSTPNVPLLSISAIPPIAVAGQSATLTWNSARVSSCNITTTPSGFFSSTAVSGSQTISFNPAATTTYTFNFSCTGTNGQTYASSTSVLVNMSMPFDLGATGYTPDGFASASINQTTHTTAPGESFTVSWSSNGMSSCTITKHTPGQAPYPWCTADVCGTNGSHVATAETIGVHSYILQCSGLHGNATAQINHRVQGAVSSGSVFTATPTSGSAPLTVLFTGSAPGNTYSIDFGDGTTVGTGTCGTTTPCQNSKITVNTSHTYQSQGVYTARLTYTCPTSSCAGSTDTIIISVTPGASPNFSFAAPLQSTSVSSGQSLSIAWSTLNPPAGSKVRLEVYPIGASIYEGNNDRGLSADTSQLSPTGTYFWPIVTGQGVLADAGHGGYSLQNGGSYRIVGKLYSGNTCWGFCAPGGEQRTIHAVAESNLWTIGGSTGAGTIAITSATGPTQLLVNQAGTWTMSATPPTGTTLVWKADWGDGTVTNNQSGSSFPHTYNATGTYNPRFTVTASNGEFGTITRTVSVTTAPPVDPGSFSGLLKATPTSGEGPLVVKFETDIPSSGGEGDSGRFTQIRFGDGSQTNVSCDQRYPIVGWNYRCGFTIYHTYRNAGTYYVDLYGTYQCPSGATLCIQGTAKVVVSSSMPATGAACKVINSAGVGEWGYGIDRNTYYDTSVWPPVAVTELPHGRTIPIRDPAMLYSYTTSSYICSNGTWYCYDKSCPIGASKTLN